MPRRSNIERLPALQRRLLDDQLEQEAFGSFDLIAKDFAKRGWKVSRSALHRYAQKKLAIRNAALMEVEVAKQSGDDAAWLMQWARAYPADAARLVKRLKARFERQQEEGKIP